MKKAFTLVELAIVIVIIGLLVGGVLAGQSLIETSRLNKEISELTSFRSAHYSFIGKYNCLPADCPNAARFFDVAKCNSMVSFSLGCVGDGNGKYDFWSGTDSRSDPHRYWIHLELANFLKGAPKTGNESTYRPANFSQFATHFAAHGDAGSYPNNLNKYNYIAFVGVLPGLCGTCSILTPYQAGYIDEKLDDGKPHTGKLKTYKGSNNPVMPPKGECLNTTSDNYEFSNEGSACYQIFSLE
jgi:prepilin-type N-terminal cleavage/methylation domain-containing protein